jgi:serine protease inhibitor
MVGATGRQPALLALFGCGWWAVPFDKTATRDGPFTRADGSTAPFLFVLHDAETGTPLFIGRVSDPSAGP